MKKIKNILLMSVFSICSLAFASVVNATSFNLNNTNLYCTPESISAGETASCYLIGTAQNAEASYSVNGFVVQAYTTQDLKILNATKNSNINGSAAVYTPLGSVSTAKPFSDKPILKDFICNFSASADATDSGCAIFYSGDAVNSPNVYTGTSIFNNAASILSKTDYATYGIVGIINVEVSDTATGEKCGELCVAVWEIGNAKDYANYKECASATGKTDSCDGATPIRTTGVNNYKCKELHLKATPAPVVEPDEPPKTGAFASYAILAAGALIAISAIAMAKKNTRFNKI